MNNNNWPIYQIDVKFEFLNGPLEEEVYAEQSHDFLCEKPRPNILQVEESVIWFEASYEGLEQKNRWFLKGGCFKKFVFNQGVYVKTNTSERVIIIYLYVDDLLVTDSKVKCISKFNSELVKDLRLSILAS